MAEQPNPVYVRLSYENFVESRRNLLSSEMSLLNVLKIIKRYDAIRSTELKMKTEMCKLVKDLDAAVKKTKSSFPFLKIPQNAKRENLKEKEAGKPKIIKETYDESLESQLKDIQERLNAIGR
jgi:hypothetical protein